MSESLPGIPEGKKGRFSSLHTLFAMWRRSPAQVTHFREDTSQSLPDAQSIAHEEDGHAFTRNLLAARPQDERIMPQIEDYDPVLFEVVVNRLYGIEDTEALAKRRARKMAAEALTHSDASRDRKIAIAERRIRRGKRVFNHA